jgi:hypothetical protein
LQSESSFADIRIPVDRPVVRERDELTDLSDSELVTLDPSGRLRRMDGALRDALATGITRSTSSRRPVFPDQGMIHRGEGVLIEEGVHEPYLEIWESVDCGPAGADAMLARRATAATGGRLVTEGQRLLLHSATVARPSRAATESRCAGA